MAVNWTGIRERYNRSAPLELLDQLRDTNEADELIIRSWALGSIGRSSESLRDLERAAELANDDPMLAVYVAAARAKQRGTNRERIDLANRLWDSADSTPDPAATRYVAATTAMVGTRHGSSQHRVAAERAGSAASERLAQDPDNPSARLSVAAADWDLDNTAAAAENLTSLRTLGYPPIPQVWALDHLVALSARDPDRARQSWVRWRELRGRPAEPWHYWVKRWCFFLLLVPWLVAAIAAIFGWVIATAILVAIATGIELVTARVIELSARRTILTLLFDWSCMALLLLL